MNILPLLILAATALSLAAIVIGLFAAWQARALAAPMQKHVEMACADANARVESVEARLEAIAAQLSDLEREPSVTMSAGLPKPGMNVVKRTQALRLHRRGDRPDQIAAALELPRQEVDLLLKVHAIVLRNV